MHIGKMLSTKYIKVDNEVGNGYFMNRINIFYILVQSNLA